MCQPLHFLSITVLLEPVMLMPVSGRQTHTRLHEPVYHLYSTSKRVNAGVMVLKVFSALRASPGIRVESTRPRLQYNVTLQCNATLLLSSRRRGCIAVTCIQADSDGCSYCWQLTAGASRGSMIHTIVAISALSSTDCHKHCR